MLSIQPILNIFLCNKSLQGTSRLIGVKCMYVFLEILKLLILYICVFFFTFYKSNVLFQRIFFTFFSKCLNIFLHWKWLPLRVFVLVTWGYNVFNIFSWGVLILMLGNNMKSVAGFVVFNIDMTIPDLRLKMKYIHIIYR